MRRLVQYSRMAKRLLARSCLVGAALGLAACGARTDLEPVSPMDAAIGTVQDAGADGRTVHRDTGVDALHPPIDSGPDTPVSPPPLDSGVGQVLLYLPNASGSSDTTFTWNGSTCVADSVAGNPSQRESTAMAAVGQSVVLFGGLSADNELLGDTWTWTAGAWSGVNQPVAPSARQSHTMGSLGDTVVLFGGVTTETSTLDDTWVWDGQSWKEAMPATSPPARSLSSMATLGDKLVMWGGTDVTGNSLADTWEWDGSDWAKIETVPSPPDSFGQTSAGLGGVVVLLDPDFATSSTETWLFDGATWSLSPATDAPFLVDFGIAAYDGRVLVYGGFSGTTTESPNAHVYAWNGASWADLGPSAVPLASDMGPTPCLMATVAP
jgi:hypothetical protein